MTMLWPGFLLLLGLIPALILFYIWMLRRRRRYAVRFSSLSLVRAAIPRHSFVRRHLPFALFLLALASLVFAMVRPVMIVNVPTDQTTIIIDLDVSGSMLSRDIQPNRLQAAEAAATTFIQRQKATTQIGIVAFSGFAEIIQAPTTDTEALQSAVESLTTGRRTAIGSGILKSIDAISLVDPNVAPSVTDPSLATEVTPVPQGAYAPDIIILLTDGVSNWGIPPLEAAQQAADRGVRIYTIGYGTAHGILPFDDPFFQGLGGGFGGGNGRGRGGGVNTAIDETTLKRIADMTGGLYYSANSANELDNVFKSLPTYLISRHETSEISVVGALLGALFATAAVFLSILWRPRV